MKTIEYKPQNPGWVGHVKVKIPMFSERMKMAGQMGLTQIAEGKIDEQVEVMGSLIAKVKDHVAEVNLSWGEEKFSSFDDLQYPKEGVELITELGLLLVNGPSLGKS